MRSASVLYKKLALIFVVLWWEHTSARCELRHPVGDAPGLNIGVSHSGISGKNPTSVASPSGIR